MNLIPVCGEIELIIYDSREKSLTYNKSITLNIGSENYCRVTIPPGLWTAFRGKSEGLNLLANLSDIEHDPEESITVLWKDGSYPQ